MVCEKNNLFMLSDLYNVRHLGGIVTRDGRVTKDYKYIRGSAKGKITPEEQEHLYNRGVRAVIDLRYSHEITKTLSPLKDYKDIKYYHVDMMGEFWQMREKGYEDLSYLYTDLLNDSQAQIHEVFKIFLAHSDASVYYHCTAGKDRTGIITMLLLDLVGVPHDVIVANYSESYENNKNRPGYVNMPEAWRRFTYSLPEYMEKTLVYLYTNYGNAENYLTHIGLTTSEINKIKQTILV